ncbi:MAG: HlyC/CorC family transporter [Verrucomicrobia bacterium]|nr:HlyC/CorC family transporter [Verrucomicrobiota bacterium]
MSQIATEIIIILLLIMVNGVLAMTEMAVVSARKTRLRRMADQRDPRARAALDLAESPTRFFSTVQVGITLVGVLAGAFGGATIAEQIAAALAPAGVPAQYAEGIGIGIVVLTITYLSLILGELVPKRIALANPERIARVMAGPMNRLAALTSPVVRLLTVSTDLVLRLIRLRESKEPPVSEDEVKLLMQEGLRAGIFHQAEPPMVESVMALDRLTVRELMTPRVKIIWINVNDPHQAIWHKIVVSGHSTFPIYENSRDNVVGVVTVKAVYANLAAGVPVNVRDLMMPPLIVSASQTAISLLECFRKARKHFALALDESGGVAGLVTLHDMMEAVLGDFPSPEERLKPTAQRRDDGSWLVDAMLEADEFERLVPKFKLDPSTERDYTTFGGYVSNRLGRIPNEGEWFESQGFRVEIIDMDRQRVDKVLLIPLNKPLQPTP